MTTKRQPNCNKVLYDLPAGIRFTLRGWRMETTRTTPTRCIRLEGHTHRCAASDVKMRVLGRDIAGHEVKP